ncbi:hypothetical protein PsorP6_015544 [Peronosclerospora sorghi]|uniref:Uncharacterized protein n=1 Tax=Peronosclerospora sorghi TaxID=230839 RepID=A0ACC0WP18_9STRA|nr:hypothetical protein PsorP6_015544 [Peronosclerospora sorghi]
MLSGNVVKLKLPAHMSFMRRSMWTSLSHTSAIRLNLKVINCLRLREEANFVIEAIRAKRIRRARTEYLVKWHGYDDEKYTWEPEPQIRHVENCKDLIQELNAKSQL